LSAHEKSVAVIGFGTVGRSLARLIAEKFDYVEKLGIRLKVVALADSKGMVLKPDGFNNYELLKLCELPRSSLKNWPGALDFDLKLLYDEVQPDVHVELTPANYETGEPGLSHIVHAINSGAHVVTANKAPLALKFHELMELARQHEVDIRFRATVMGGTPLIDTLLSIRSYAVESIQGILNATTNFILTEMHSRLISMEEALRKAQAIGVAEADPRLDLEGWDPAAKIVILSNVIGRKLNLHDVLREPLTVKLSDVIECLRENQIIKYIAGLERSSKAYVKPVRLSKDDLLAGISGTLNAVRITTTVGEILFAGKGGGGFETAYNVLDDVIAVVMR
jgi:homoserine dehydrogenase